MDLSTVVKDTQTELLLQLTSDGSFTEWTRGRLAPVDRFLSNFHKPLQRRMLHTDPKDPLPALGVIKLKATGEIYLVGDSREDSSNDETFDRLNVLHLVSNNSSGICEYFNYHNDLADPAATSPINIGLTSEGEFYVAVEYISTKTMESGDEAYQGKFFIYGQSTLPFKRDGYFSIHGVNYKVVQALIDSGFSCAIALQQDDDMVPITYKQINEATSGYNVASGVMDLNYTEYTFAGTIDRTTERPDGTLEFQIFIKHDPLPITISAGNLLSLPDGQTAKIITIHKDKNTQGQLQLTCEGG